MAGFQPLVLLACSCFLFFFLSLVALACCSGLLLWLVLLACSSGLFFWLGIHAVFRCPSLALRPTFKKTKRWAKVFFATSLPCGCLRHFLKSSYAGPHLTHIHVQNAHAPSWRFNHPVPGIHPSDCAPKSGACEKSIQSIF